MRRVMIVAVLAALMGGCASKPGQVRDDYVLDGVSEEQFTKDYSECTGIPYTASDADVAVIAPGLLIPDSRASMCMAGKGYKMVPAYERQSY